MRKKHSEPPLQTSFYVFSANSLFSNHNVIKILKIIDASLKGTIIAETSAARSCLLLETQQLLKRPPKVQVEDGVDDWVEGGVDVAQPRHKVREFITRTARITKRNNHIHEKERQPAQDEHAHDDSQGPGGTPLF